jgi:AcrR family transcriptional regulator
MAQVASAAGVSRQTLYNEFGTRDELVQAYVLWAAEGFLDEVERVVATHDTDLSGALVAAFGFFLDTASEHPLLRALGAATGSEGLHALVATAQGVPIVAGGTDRLTQIVTTTWPEAPEDDARVLCEVIVRLAISYLTVPTASANEATSQVAQSLGPYLAAVEAELGPDTCR